MVSLRLLSWGRIHTPGLSETADHYEARIKPWAKLEVQTLKSDNDRARDTTRLLAELSSRPRDILLVLSEHGRAWDTPRWARTLEQAKDSSKTLTIALGAANGLEVDRLKQTASGTPIELVSFGPAVLAHELAHVVLLEQLYRGLSILERHPYHRA